LVSRSKAADDARRLELTLTPAARVLLRKAPGAAQNRLIDAVKKLPGAARSQLAKSLSRLVEAAGLGDEEAPMIFEDGLSSKAAKPRAGAGRRAAVHARR